MPPKKRTKKITVKLPLSKREFVSEVMRDISEYSKDPLGFVMYAFPWGRPGELENSPGPEDWQIDILNCIKDGLLTVNEAIQIAVASGHGIGKSTLVAWIILWSLSTFEDTKGVVTANTETQLKTKTWAELAKWHRLFIGKDFFTFTATAIFSVDKEHEKTWRFDMISWSENNTEAFAGMHNKGKRVVIIMDEASAISDKIWEVTEGALTDSDTEIMWFAFGNPTRGNGRFHACFHGLRHRWKTWQIDSRKVRITNKTQIQKWVDDMGEDSDFVRVRVRGMFPNASEHQFIPASFVETARTRRITHEMVRYAPKILTLDPAWKGGDEIVIGFRQGNLFEIKATFQKNDDDFKLAGHLAKWEDEVKADAVLIDLGYGTGVYSAGKQMNRNWTLIPFGEASTDPGFVNLRADMWNKMKMWLRDGGAIPNDPTLLADLVAPEAYVVATGKNAGKIYLESKEDMRARGLPSPGRADALALSFSRVIMPKIHQHYEQMSMQKKFQEYDPFRNL